jgi:acyl carrier protein
MLEMERDARAAIRGFIVERLAPATGRTDVADEEDLIDTGIVDSLGIFHLVAFLEERFGLKVRDDEITPDNFGTIAAIKRLVAARGR